jgi:hypothetical protein
MKTMRTSILGLTATALILVALAPRPADAGIRVSATLRTPNIGIHLSTGQPDRCPGCVRVPLPVRRHAGLRLAKHDRQVAARLADFTGVRKQELLRLRRHGYSWLQIGLHLGLSRQAVNASFSARTWQRYLNGPRPYVKCGTALPGPGHHGAGPRGTGRLLIGHHGH